MLKNEKKYGKKNLLKDLSEKSGISKKNVNVIITELQNIIKKSFIKDKIETFTFPGIFKLTLKNIPPQKERNIINPFTKKEITIPAKNETKKIKIKLLKKIKDLIK